MNEFFKNVLSVFEDRSKSRLWPTFTVVWIVHNWKFFFIAIRSPYSEKDNPLSILEPIATNYTDFILVPLGFAFLLVIIVPYLDAAIGWIQYIAIYWNKGVNTSLQARVDIRKAKLIKKQAAALMQIESSGAIVESVKHGGTDFDLQIHKKLDAILNETDIRSIISSMSIEGLVYDSMMTSIKNYLINGNNVDCRFKNIELNALHGEFFASLNLFNNAIRSEMSSSSNGFKFDPAIKQNPKKEKVMNLALLTIEKYVSYREKVREIFQQ